MKGLLIFMILFFVNSQNGLAENPPLLDTLSGSWDTFGSFVTQGACIGAPTSALIYECAPFQRLNKKEGYLVGSIFGSGTEKSLEFADKLRSSQENFDPNLLSSTFEKYNYTEAFGVFSLSYVSHYFSLGVMPVRSFVSFQIHNPQLPFISVQYRNDISLFLNGGVRFYWDPIRIRIGGEISIIQRNLKILETNIIDAVSRGKDAMDRNIYYGWFSQFGGQLELYEWVNFSFLFKDVGYFWGSKKLKSYIYIYPDRVPKVFFIPSITPKIWLFTLQIGPEWIWFFNENNQIEKQWIGTANVYLGPLRVLSGFRSGFLRTGVGLKLPTSDISIAQEWQNQIQENRFSERRFTLSGSWAI